MGGNDHRHGAQWLRCCGTVVVLRQAACEQEMPTAEKAAVLSETSKSSFLFSLNWQLNCCVS